MLRDASLLDQSAQGCCDGLDPLWTPCRADCLPRIGCKRCSEHPVGSFRGAQGNNGHPGGKEARGTKECSPPVRPPSTPHSLGAEAKYLGAELHVPFRCTGNTSRLLVRSVGVSDEDEARPEVGVSVRPIGPVSRLHLRTA